MSPVGAQGDTIAALLAFALTQSSGLQKARALSFQRRAKKKAIEEEERRAADEAALREARRKAADLKRAEQVRVRVRVRVS